jgi:hypothetical protein
MRSILAIRQTTEIQQMTTAKMSDEALLAFLGAHPDLRDRFASIVSAVENSEGDLKEADAAEEAARRGDAAFWAGGAARVGRQADRSDGTRSS